MCVCVCVCVCVCACVRVCVCACTSIIFPLGKEFPTATMETAQLSTDQLPPDLLLDSEASPATATAAPPVSRPSSTAALVYRSCTVQP